MCTGIKIQDLESMQTPLVVGGWERILARADFQLVSCQKFHEVINCYHEDLR